MTLGENAYCGLSFRRMHRFSSRRRTQLRELALLNGTLREGEGPRCTNCGAADHKAWQCQDKANITNSIVCSACGNAGHIARDCQQRRPGTGFGPGGEHNKTKMDDEVGIQLCVNA